MVDAAATFRVVVPDPGAATVAGEKVAVMPAGMPATRNAIGALKPSVNVVVICVVPLPPCATASVAGAPMVKAGPGSTVTLIAAVFVTPAPVAVTVSAKVFKAVATVVVTFRVLAPEPGAASDAGENAAVIPAGIPLTRNATVALYEPTRLTTICAELLLPALSVSVDGSASVKPGAGWTVRVSGVILDVPPLVATTLTV